MKFARTAIPQLVQLFHTKGQVAVLQISPPTHRRVQLLYRSERLSFVTRKRIERRAWLGWPAVALGLRHKILGNVGGIERGKDVGPTARTFR